MIAYIRNPLGEQVPTMLIPPTYEFAKHLHDFPFRTCPCPCHNRPNVVIDLATMAVYEIQRCGHCNGTRLVPYASFN